MLRCFCLIHVVYRQYDLVLRRLYITYSCWSLLTFSTLYLTMYNRERYSCMALKIHDDTRCDIK